jgi:L-alanine-DL-glutamate epimerase-like enolase superfamily enzyme
VKVRVIESQLLLTDELRISTGVSDRAEKVFVVVADEGNFGWGEASINRPGIDRNSILGYFAGLPDLRDADPLAYRSTMARIDANGGNCPAGRMAIEMALYDLAGKLMSTPAFRLLGVDPLETKELCYTIGIDNVDSMVSASVQAAMEHRALKVKLGTPNDEDIVREICAAVNVPVRVDVNGGWSFEHAVEMIDRVLAPCGVQILEQPISAADRESQKRLHQRSSIPIYLDESITDLDSVDRAADCCSGIDIKLAKCGGIAMAGEMISRARSLGMGVMIGCELETSLAISAAAMLTPLADYADLDLFLRFASDPFIGLQLTEGRFVLSSAPGLGVTASASLQADLEKSDGSNYCFA